MPLNSQPTHPATQQPAHPALTATNSIVRGAVRAPTSVRVISTRSNDLVRVPQHVVVLPRVASGGQTLPRPTQPVAPTSNAALRGITTMYVIRPAPLPANAAVRHLQRR